MEVTADELAGVVDLFGVLSRAELQRALAELAFKREGEFDPEAFAAAVEDAVDSYHLLAVHEAAVQSAGEEAANAADGADAEPAWLVAGPVAFPDLPADAADLPHIMDVGERAVDREAVGRAAEERFRVDAAAAVDAGDPDRIAELLDVSYELEAWAPVDLAAARERLDAEDG